MKLFLSSLALALLLWYPQKEAVSSWAIPSSSQIPIKKGKILTVAPPLVTDQGYTLRPMEFSGNWFAENAYLHGPSLHLPHGARMVSLQLSAWFGAPCEDPGSVTVTAKLGCTPLPLGNISELVSVTVSSGSSEEAIGGLESGSASYNVRTQPLSSPHVFDSGQEYCHVEIEKKSGDDALPLCRTGIGAMLNQVTIFYTVE